MFVVIIYLVKHFGDLDHRYFLADVVLIELAELVFKVLRGELIEFVFGRVLFDIGDS